MNYKKIPRKQFLYEISRLYYIDKISQKELSSIYKVSISTISRVLKEAETLGIVIIKVNDILGKKDKLESDLERRFGLKKVLVSQISFNDEDLIKSIIGKSAASYIGEIIQNDSTVGIAWGNSLYEMVNYLNPRPLDNMKVVDLIGSMGKVFSNANASELTRKFAQNFSARIFFLNSLAMVDNKETKEHLVKEKEIKDVLDMAKNLDIAIISIGNFSPDSIVFKGLGIEKDVIEDIKSRGALGDICFRFFDQYGNKVYTEFDDRIVGIDLDDYKKVKTKICISGGISKLIGIRAAIKNKLVDVLITDSLVAESLLRN